MTAEKLRWMGKAVRYTTAAMMEMFNGASSWAAVKFEDNDGNVVEYKEKFCLAIANSILLLLFFFFRFRFRFLFPFLNFVTPFLFFLLFHSQVSFVFDYYLYIVTAAKGMKMAPHAKLNDGLIDLLLIRSHKTFDLLSIFTKVYDGSHTDLEHVEYKQVKWFSIVPFNKEGEVILDVEGTEEIVDIDGMGFLSPPSPLFPPPIFLSLPLLSLYLLFKLGELKGATPFKCEMIRNAILVII